MEFSAGSQLAQVRPSGTTAVSAYEAGIRTEITRVVVCNTTGAAVDFSLYHDDDGNTFDQSTALYYEVSLGANETLEIISESVGSGLMVASGGQIGARASAANALTFTLYGITANIARSEYV